MGPRMDSINLNGWVARWRGGDTSGADELLRAVYPRLEALARKMLRGFPRVRGMDDTLDVLQNSVVRLMRALRELDPPPATTREFFGLAAMQIRRELLDLARAAAAEKRRGGVALGAGDPAGFDEADARADLESWAAFHGAVERLPAEEREVVGLIFYHGWTRARVAELFGVDERTVRRRWQAALGLVEKDLGLSPSGG